MSHRRLDKIVVVDLEATCWESSIEKPVNMRQEIIEIGACYLNLTTMKPEQKTSYYIRPSESDVSPFCTQLTGITNELLTQKGIPFGDAINKFKKEFSPLYRTWMSWGAYDLITLKNQCDRRYVDYPMGVNHINAKNLFSIRKRLVKEMGMAKALRYSNLELEGQHHCGADDAWNTARLIALIL